MPRPALTRSHPEGPSRGRTDRQSASAMLVNQHLLVGRLPGAQAPCLMPCLPSPCLFLTPLSQQLCQGPQSALCPEGPGQSVQSDPTTPPVSSDNCASLITSLCPPLSHSPHAESSAVNHREAIALFHIVMQFHDNDNNGYAFSCALCISIITALGFFRKMVSIPNLEMRKQAQRRKYCVWNRKLPSKT